MGQKGCFFKGFRTFEEGVQELWQVSFSAQQALLHPGYGEPPTHFTEVLAVSNLVGNVLCSMIHPLDSRLTDAQIDISPGYVGYTTCSGLSFGWSFIMPNDDDYHETELGYTFWISHPKAAVLAAPEESTLRRSAEGFGWLEKLGQA